MAKASSLIGKYKFLILILIFGAILRFWRLGSVPVSLYVDELDVGYQALSILKTSKDYFGNPWPLHFQSFAEYRTPFNIYTTVPAVAMFGLTPFAVRLPSAVFGILSVCVMYLTVGEILKFSKTSINIEKRNTIALTSAAILAISPWHLQFSRVALEVVPMLFFMLLGIYLFFKALKEPKFLWLSALSFAFTPWIYSTAKLFTPFFVFALIILFRKELKGIPVIQVLYSVLVVLVFAIPMLYVIIVGKGGMRFSYISVFTDPTAPTEVGYAREFDSDVRGEEGVGRQPTIFDKFFHNKPIFWQDKVLGNYFSALSTNFLFTEGDPNLRHSPNGVGMFYLIEILPLLIGTILFFSKYKNKQIKVLVILWILLGIIPSAITRDGGNHAARLIIILPPLIFLITYGLVEGAASIKNLGLRVKIIMLYTLIWIASFVYYQHNYWIHYPWDSERWWGSGWEQAIHSIKQVDSSYDKVFISREEEQSLIYFAGWYGYDPAKWQEIFSQPDNYVKIGTINALKVGKYYFPDRTGKTLEQVASDLKEGNLYLANASELSGMDAETLQKINNALKRIEVINFPSGEDAFYLYSHR